MNYFEEATKATKRMDERDVNWKERMITYALLAIAEELKAIRELMEPKDNSEAFELDLARE